MTKQLTGREERWLLNEVGELIALVGANGFLTAPLLEPTEAFFPDRWEPSRAGVRRLALRLLAYAGLDAVDAHVTVSSLEAMNSDDSEFLRGHANDGRVTVAWFRGFSEMGTARFGVAEELLNDPDRVVGAMCHEVAHAWREYHRVRADEHAVDEKLTDLTTVFLGFGILTANAAYRYRTGTTTSMSGSPAYGWSHEHLGYLSLDAMSFLLAAQVHARELGWRQRWRIAGLLEANQEGAFKRGLRRLKRERDFHYILGLKKQRQGKRIRVAKPPPEKTPGAVQPDFLRQSEPVRRDRRWFGLIAGAVLGGGVAVAAGHDLALRLATAALLAGLGLFVGRSLRREHCGVPECGAPLLPESYYCGQCGSVRVAGET